MGPHARRRASGTGESQQPRGALRPARVVRHRTAAAARGLPGCRGARRRRVVPRADGACLVRRQGRAVVAQPADGIGLRHRVAAEAHGPQRDAQAHPREMGRVRLTRAGLGPWALGLGLWTLGTNWLWAQSNGLLESTFFDGASHPAIGYGVRPADDPVAKLEGALERGEARLEFDSSSGYLRSLLQALDVNVDTQLAVFSKTS